MTEAETLMKAALEKIVNWPEKDADKIKVVEWRRIAEEALKAARR